MEEAKTITEIIEVVINSWLFKLIIGGVFTALLASVIAAVKNTNKKIKDSLSKSELVDGIKSAKKYTDEKIKTHEKIHTEENKRYDDLKHHIDTRFDDIILIIQASK